MTRARDLADIADKDIAGTLTADAYALGSIALPSAGTATIFNRNTDNSLYIQTDSGNTVYLLDDSQNTMYAATPTSHVFQISNAEKVRIDSSGNVGINTSSAVPLDTNAQLLAIHGDAVGAERAQIKLTTTTSGQAAGDGFYIAVDDSAAYISQRENQPLIISTNATERMRIDSSGSVGIGSTNPIGSAQRLHIQHPAGTDTALPTVKITRANNAGGGAGNDEIGLEVNVPSSYNQSNYVYGIKTYAEHNLYGRQYGIYAEVEKANSDNSYAGYFKGGHSDTNGSNTPKVVYIDQQTTVGVANTGYSIGCYIKQDDYTKNEFMRWDTGYSGTQTMNALRIYRNGSQIGGITTTTSSTSYNTSSDYRLKENVTDVTDGITRLKQLAPKRFNFIAEPDTTVDGFIAHEAQAVVPEAVTGTQDAVDVEGNPEYQGIDQSKLVPLLTAALQEAIAKIETLETEMTSVKARLDALEAG